MKKTILKICTGFVAAIILLSGYYAIADDSTQTLLNPWSVISGYIKARSATYGVQVPSLASSGNCIKTDANGKFSTTACGSGGGGAWGSITGTLSSQTDLQGALDAKLATTTAAATYQTILTNPVTGTGTATQVAVFSSASALTSDSNLYWDNVNKALGVGGTPGTAKLYVSGNVGIGTTTPNNFKLQVAGNIGPTVSDTYDIGSSALHYNNVYANNFVGAMTPSGFTQGPVVFGGASGALTQDNAFFWDNTNKRLGIGTTSPKSKLSINGDSTGYEPSLNANAISNFNISRGDVGSTNLAFSISAAVPFTASIQHRHSSVDGISYPIALNPLGGNVGIGTTSPETTLQVQGVASIQNVTNPYLRIADSSTSNGNRKELMLQYITGGDYGRIDVFHQGTGARPLVLQDQGGNVGIGTTTPLTKLAVVGTMYVSATSTLATTSITSLLLPAASAPILASSGNIAVNTASGSLSFHDGTAQRFLNPEHLLYPFYIENPGSNEDIGVFIANATTTITKVLCVNKGGSDTANFNLVWDNSRQTATTTTSSKLFSAFTACSATTTPVSLGSFASTTINTLQAVRFITSTASTSGMTLTIYGRENQ